MSDYYILVRDYKMPWPNNQKEKSRTVYVKEGNFFEEQGGLKEDWGKSWIKVQADSIDHARLIGHIVEIDSGN